MKVIPVLLLISVLFACTTTPSPSPTPTKLIEPSSTPVPSLGTEGFPWWNDTVFYEIFVRSFRDSDGDGIGDFNGVIEKLDYLQELGIRGIWLMPIHPTPSYHGYHVTDYYDVNSEYGTMEDFKRLLEEAHQRNIKVIIDFVLNHTSDQHPWFQAALTPGSEYHDWYVWSPTDPGTRGPWGQQVWHEGPNGGYYYAVYVSEIPDLNYYNPAVREEAKKITSFWLKEIRLDGLRLDGVRYWVEDNKLADADANHKFLEEWGEFYRNINPEAFTVGEAWTENTNVKKYTETDREVDAAFNFDLSTALLYSANGGNNGRVRLVLGLTIKDFPQQDNANFLTNHDMPRVMNQLSQDTGKAKAAAAILLTAPGIPFIYYGEEIGMSGTKPDELIRTPMQWTGEDSAGFTEGTPWEPINSDFTTINAAKQTGENDSLLEHYRKLIKLRNAHPALRVGQTYIAESNSSRLLAYLRASKDETLLILVNLDDAPITDYDIDLSTGPLSGNYNAVSLLDDAGTNPVQANDSGGFENYTPLAEIPPYQVIVIQLTPQ